MNKIVCVQCPIGCKIKFEQQDGKIIKIDGNRCPRGIAYLRDELKEPRRIVPTSVKVINGVFPLVSVKTSKPVPKKYISELMNEIKKISVQAPVKSGDVILKNVFGTGADIIATRTVPQKQGSN